MKLKKQKAKTTLIQKEFQLSEHQIRNDKILAIFYAIWSIANLIIFIPHFKNQQFEKIFPFNTLNWQYYNFLSFILLTFFIPQVIHYIIKLFRIHQHKKNEI